MNRKRTYRVYREAGLAVRRRKSKRIAGVERVPAMTLQAPNVSSSMDFVSDGLADGRRLQCLNIVDDFTRECLAIEVDTSLTGRRAGVCRKIMDEWAYTHGVHINFIQPGKPTQNCFVERFNGRFRDKCPNEHRFLSMSNAREIIENWRKEYNEERLHSNLKDITPKEFADRFLTADSTSNPYQIGSQVSGSQNPDKSILSLPHNFWITSPNSN